MTEPVQPNIQPSAKFSFLGKHAGLKLLMLVLAAIYTTQFWFFQKIWCTPQQLFHRVWQTTGDTLFDKAALKNWPTYEHKYDSRIKTEDDAIKCANEMLKTLDDPFTKFLDPKQVAKQQDSHNGLYSGVGMVMNGKKKPIVVRMLIEGGPAERAGIKAGDLIYKVDELNCLTIPAAKIGEYTRQHMGKVVKFTIRRNGKEMVVDMIPAKMSVPSTRTKTFSTQLPGRQIAYVRIENFVRNDLVSIVRSEFDKVKNASALILDLRGNPGGSVESCLAIASMLMVTGDLVAMKSRSGAAFQTVSYHLDTDNMTVTTSEPDKGPRQEQRQRQANQWQNKPLVVLIDDGSASASEMLGAALHDNKRATLLGTRTYGKGVAQLYYDMPLSTCLSVTAGRYYTPDGKWLGDGRDLEEGKPVSADRGIPPDIEVKAMENLNYGAVDDNQIAAARTLIEERLSKSVTLK